MGDIDGIMGRAEKAGVRFMVSCSTVESDFMLTARLADQYNNILPCFGIHPWFVHKLSRNWKQNLEDYLLSYPSGIGETGLDFAGNTGPDQIQIQVFEYHLNLAIKLERPICVHIRKAWDTFIHILKKTGRLKVPGIIHSYSGSADMIPLFERYGFYISFSGSVTRPGAKKVVNALERVSCDRFVLETDSPDIYPSLPDGRSCGALNEPSNLPLIAGLAARRIQVPLTEFAENAYKNTLDVFQGILKDTNTER
jgi:TatD DNase family protein